MFIQKYRIKARIFSERNPLWQTVTLRMSPYLSQRNVSSLSRRIWLETGQVRISGVRSRVQTAFAECFVAV